MATVHSLNDLRALDGDADTPAPIVARHHEKTKVIEDVIESFPPASPDLEDLFLRLRPVVRKKLAETARQGATRGTLAKKVEEIVREGREGEDREKTIDERNLVTFLLNDLISFTGITPAGSGGSREAGSGKAPPASNRSKVENANLLVRPMLLDRLDTAAAAELPRGELAKQIEEVLGEILQEHDVRLNQLEQRDLVTSLVNDMMGLGPLEKLLEDETVTDIMINGSNQVFVERRGKLELTDIVFQNDAHLMNVATRIVTRIGRRIDETTPLVDARLEDGSRVNIIIPPLAIDGPSVSIRKFSRKRLTLETMVSQNNTSDAMATVLKIASRSRLNILISGGTGSGKTTLLNALSATIDPGERVVTIEDAAELQLQQPHVVRLETRPPNLEGQGEIIMRDLVRNALRMRPDRIILGEIRGAEALDMLQAMNTGHEGSMCTIHANRPREALTRLENMVAMANVNLPARAVRGQIAEAVDLIVQVSRMRDGVRRIVNITEVVGMEGEVITTQELFRFDFEGEGDDGILRGHFRSTGTRPNFLSRAEYYGLGRALMEVV
ncbi:MAG: CpaF family protein [Alphaproteobacteria bacterium]|nr:CpaF family protein [Alphaproteobacteria bacterium]